MKYKPRKLPNKNAYVLDIPHPRTKRRTTCGLGTDSEKIATEIAIDYERLLDRPSLLRDAENHTYDLIAFKLKAVELALGSDHPAIVKIKESQNPEIGLTTEDMQEVAARIADENANAVSSYHSDKFMGVDAAAPGEIETKRIQALLEKFMPLKVRQLNDRVAELLRENAAIKILLEEKEKQVQRYGRAANVHVTTTVADAFTAFKNTEKFKRKADQTRNDMARSFDLFMKSLPSPDFKLADLRHTFIDTWLNGLKKEDGTPYSTRSLELHRAYVRAIVNWMYRTYDLSENPTEKLEPAVSPDRDRFEIEAFKTEADVKEMLATLETVDPYWHALIATALLAGPRYSELISLHIDDVDLSQNLINVRGLRDKDGNTLKGTKTGKRRRTPIERTTLLPILTKYVRDRKKVQSTAGDSVADASHWLFQSAVPENPFTLRVVALPGIWSSAKVFATAWERVVAKCRKITGDRYYWEHGPREFRHSACTILGNSGVDADDGSAWVGNSEKIWRDHYAHPSSGGNRWSFQY